VKSPVELGKWRMWNRCFLKRKRISAGNYLEEEEFYPDEFHCEIGGYHPL
jgi:hypothetical protein